jgi:DNA-binding response OmpR family regulator
MLNCCRVLIVEDEAVVAEDFKHILTDAEAAVIGPFASVSEARRLLEGGTPDDAALLDVNLSDSPVTPVLKPLRGPKAPETLKGQ